ncbi:nucleotidyltransferase [Streptomyces albipurpureus]|uniref:Nucleotidyltransferase n=1 Tax=Streptomyces albipurpureus TaxID=2897419 RepID=A0ABT0UQD1_9ACTN|nr:nucleotidyltransferase [Streptomyces sp. CWNU-1]MCM2389830.1 nucleotidyltransferase [Streptomyces sp. CWNU-1]
MADHDPSTRRLLLGFVAEVRPLVSPIAIWAHGSLGGGDYQPGRSDIDLIAVIDRACSPEEWQQLAAFHRRLIAEFPLAAKLHCSYPLADELADVKGEHLTWAHQELFHRPVTEVTRRELYEFGVVLHGLQPADLLAPVTEGELVDFLIGEMNGPWRAVLEKPRLWLQDGWVDFGMLALARATVTLRSGGLITKAEAIEVLVGELDAPIEVVDDIRSRRYGTPAPASPEWLDRRAELTVAFLRAALDRLPGRPDGP